MFPKNVDKILLFCFVKETNYTDYNREKTYRLNVMILTDTSARGMSSSVHFIRRVNVNVIFHQQTRQEYNFLILFL